MAEEPSALEGRPRLTVRERLSDPAAPFVVATTAGFLIASAGIVLKEPTLILSGGGAIAFGEPGIGATPETQTRMMGVFREAVSQTFSLAGVKRALDAFNRVVRGLPGESGGGESSRD
jgi:hypothetical protein